MANNDRIQAYDVLIDDGSSSSKSPKLPPHFAACALIRYDSDTTFLRNTCFVKNILARQWPFVNQLPKRRLAAVICALMMSVEDASEHHFRIDPTMPKITDAEETKVRIVKATWEIIATEGIQAATLRRVASQIRCSTGLITHYFADKDELVTHAYRLVLDKMIEAATERITCEHDIERRLIAAIEAIEPSDAQMKEFTIVMMNFWAQAAFNPAFAEQCRLDYKRWREMIAETICQAIEARELRPDADVRMLTNIVTLLSDGFSVGMTLTPSLYPKNHRRAIIRQILSPYLNPKSGTPD